MAQPTNRLMSAYWAGLERAQLKRSQDNPSTFATDLWLYALKRKLQIRERSSDGKPTS